MDKIVIYACRRPIVDRSYSGNVTYPGRDIFKAVQDSRIIWAAELPLATCSEDYQEKARQMAANLKSLGITEFRIRNGLEYDESEKRPRKVIPFEGDKAAVRPIVKDKLRSFRAGLLNFLRGA